MDLEMAPVTGLI